MQYGIGSRGHGECLEDGSKAGCGDAEFVDANGSLGQFKCAFGIGRGVQNKVGIGRLERDLRAGDGAVLGVVDDSMDSGEDGGQGGDGGEEQSDEKQATGTKTHDGDNLRKQQS